MIVIKEFAFLGVVAMETGKDSFYLSLKWLLREKRFIKKLNFIDRYYHCKIELIVWAVGQKKCHNFKNINFKKKGSKVKKNYVLHFMTNFHNFALKINTIWAKRAIRSILETRYVNDVRLYYVVYSISNKNFTKIQGKNE